MKTGKRVPASLLLWFLPLFSLAQCVTPLETVTFDSTVTGTGNSFHTFTFPKFNASLGTLVEVNIRAEVTLRYRFQLENKENIAINNYRVRVVREDEISGSVLQTPITSTGQATYGPYMLAAYDGVNGSGPDYTSIGPMYVMNRQLINQTVYNTADYLGGGNVSIDYMASTYSIVFGSVNYNFNGTAEDTVRIVVAYRYCTTWFLPAELTEFTAVKAGNDEVRLRWTTPNEKRDRRYTIQTSSDGRSFTDAATLPASNGRYQQTYTPRPNQSGKIVFRLRQTEADGTVKYSGLRVVDIGTKTNGLRLYPNPSDGAFNILFSNTTRGDWAVNILSQDGRVLRSYDFNGALTARINLKGQLAAGSYFIRAINKRTMEQQVQQLLLR